MKVFIVVELRETLGFGRGENIAAFLHAQTVSVGLQKGLVNTRDEIFDDSVVTKANQNLNLQLD